MSAIFCRLFFGKVRSLEVGVRVNFYRLSEEIRQEIRQAATQATPQVNIFDNQCVDVLTEQATPQVIAQVATQVITQVKMLIISIGNEMLTKDEIVKIVEISTIKHQFYDKCCFIAQIALVF